MSKNPSNEMLLKDGKFNIELMKDQLSKCKIFEDAFLEKDAFLIMVNVRNTCFVGANKFDSKILNIYNQLLNMKDANSGKEDIHSLFVDITGLILQMRGERRLIYDNQPQEIKDLFEKLTSFVSTFGLPDNFNVGEFDFVFDEEYKNRVSMVIFPDFWEKHHLIYENLHTLQVKDNESFINELNILYNQYKERKQTLNSQSQEVRIAIKSLIDFMIETFVKNHKMERDSFDRIVKLAGQDKQLMIAANVTHCEVEKLTKVISNEVLNPTFEVIAKALDKLSTAPVKNSKQMADKIQKFQLSKEQEFEEIIQSNETLLKP